MAAAVRRFVDGADAGSGSGAGDEAGPGSGIAARMTAAPSFPTGVPDLAWRLLPLVDELMRAGAADPDKILPRPLARLAATLDADRAAVVLADGGSWSSDGSLPVGAALSPADRARLEAEGALQPDAGETARLGLGWRLMLPLAEGGTLVLDGARPRRRLTPEEILPLRPVAAAIGALLARRARDREIALARRELQDERARRKATLDAMPDLMIELDHEGRFIAWHAGRQSSGAIRPEDFLGRRLEETLSADVAALARRIMAEVDAHGSSAGHEYRIRLPHGLRSHWISAARLAPQGTEGRPAYLVVVRDMTEAQAQRRQAERLGLFARLTTNLVIAIDAERRIDWMNAAAEAATGYALAEAQGRPLCAVLHCQQTTDIPRERLREMLGDDAPHRIELLAQARDGRAYWLDLSIQPLVEADGHISGRMIVGRDISLYKRQAAQLEATARDALAARGQLAAAVEVLPDAFAYYDAEDRLVLCNARYYQYYPRSAAAIVPGATFEEILRHGLARGEYREAIGREEEWLAARLAAHREEANEQEQQLADGRWLRVLERSTPEGGRVGLRMDITALKLAEQRARADLTSAMDASRDGIAITDAAGCYLYMNSAHREMFGIPDATDILGQRWQRLYDPETAAHLERTAIPVLLAEGGWRGEVTGRRFDGTELPQEVSLTLKEDGGIICISRDISKRLREQQEEMRLREELQMAQRREVIGQLASGLAHDLNNLLAAIGGSATLMRDAGPLEAEAHAQRILAATEQAGALLRRFLSLGQRQSNRSRIDLRAPLREAVDLVRASLRNQTRLRLDLPEAPVEVTADPTDILQVVLNLVINARDAIAGLPPRPEGYEIAIGLRAAEAGDLAGPFAAGNPAAGQGHVCISIADDGPGIEAAVQARVFQPYFSTKGAAGTGLGLAIVAGVLVANQGAVALDSAPGRGTRFNVLWPAELGEARPEAPPLPAPPPEPLPEPEPEVRPAGPLSGRLALVVDDNPDVLHILGAFLEQAGAEVVPCADPRDALAALRDDPGLWDLVVTDYDMPEVTGADLAMAAQAVAPGLPVLLITALPDWRMRLAGKPTPRFAGVLGKPLTRADLIAAAEAALKVSAPAPGAP